jgi:actinorhodin biosynthesis protein ActVIA
MDVALYVDVLQFYAHQMQALDSGKFTEFAETFTPDGEFTHTVGRPAARGRDGIVADLTDFHRTSVGDSVQRRHWFNMHSVTPLDDGTVEATVYALVMRILPGGRPEITFSGLAHDILVRTNGQLLNRSRTVVNDAARPVLK